MLNVMDSHPITSRRKVSKTQKIARKPIPDSQPLEISTEEKYQILQVFNHTGENIPIDKTIDRAFDEQADRTPGAIALVHHELHVTYSHLHDRANRLAAQLLARGLQKENCVAIIVDRSTWMFTGLLGILNAGGAYLPIDPEAPPLRTHYILKDSRASLVLTTNSYPHKNELIALPGFSPQFLDIEDPHLYKTVPKLPPHNATTSRSPKDLAYIIYTSGSTGRPKGVLVEHRNLLAYLAAFNREFNFTPEDTVVQQASYFFDTFAEEVYSVLLKGGKIAIPEHHELLDIRLFIDFVNRFRVSVIDCSPLLLNELNRRIAELTPRPNTSPFTFISGGDVLKGEYIDNLLTIGTVHNTYGPTEGTICATYYRCQLPLEPLVPIGKPISGYSVYILAKNGDLAPIGIAGELCISGPGVSRGYLNQPLLTMEKFVLPSATRGFFVKPPLDPEKLLFRQRFPVVDYPSPLYRTGDLARWRPDGNIVFMGRMDHQVSIWGFRVEVGEVEAQLMAHPNIKDAVVTALEDKHGENYLCAYVIPWSPADPLTSPGLRQFLFKRLPYYMIPLHFEFLSHLPLTPTGKIDRMALPVPQSGASDSEYIPPATDIEKGLVKIWSEILGIKEDTIGAAANFFRLGGHSLKATLLTSEIYKAFQVALPTAEVFTAPTIRALARCIEAAKVKGISAIPAIECKEYYPLTPAQKRMFLVQQWAPDSIAYNISDVAILDGELNGSPEKLADIFRLLVNRHESFRTSFEIIGGEPAQRIHESIPFQPDTFGIECEFTMDPGFALADSSDPRPYDRIIADFIRPFDLSRAPLLRVGLIPLPAPGSEAPSTALLLLDMHHIIADGLSLEVLEKEFTALARGETLSPVTLRYRDYAAWLNRRLAVMVNMGDMTDTADNTGEIKNQESYWLNRFQDSCPTLSLPLDFPRPERRSFAGKQVRFRLNRQESLLLKGMAAEEQVTPFVLLLGIYTIFIAKLSGGNDIVIGSPAAGRIHPDVQHLVGMFVNTLALRFQPHGSKTWPTFLKEVNTGVLEAFSNQDYQFEDLVDALHAQSDAGRNPLFDVMFTLRSEAEESADAGDNTILNKTREIPPSYDYFSPVARFDLTLIAIEEKNELAFILEYSTALFKEDTAARFIEYFKHLVTSLLASPGQTLACLDFLPAEEKQRLLYDFNNTTADYPKDKTLPQLFAEQAESSPDRLALVGQVSLTYGELYRLSGCLAAWLRQDGVRPDTVIGLIMPRSVEMVTAIFGILRAGGAYLPIDPQLPPERIDYILNDSNTGLVITMEMLPAFKLNRPEDTGKRLACSENPTSLAYIIYTSGSTGNPKGVMIEHRSVVNLLTALQRRFPVTGKDSYIFKSTFMFDFSIAEIFGWFMAGGRSIVLEPGGEKEPGIIMEVIEKQSVSHVNFVPSMFQVMTAALHPGNIGKLSSLKYIFVGGEALLPAVLNRFRALNAPAKLENVYGPTETTVYATEFPLAEWQGDGPIPIGKPFPNTTTYILDVAMNPVPYGVAGELYIGGEGTARGYFNRPELTEEKFCLRRAGALFEKTAPAPRKNFLLRLSAIYRTGDLCRWRTDGNIEFLGRIDHQVKIRGFRIETGEIENRLMRHPAIDKAVVMVKERSDGDKYLCAYVKAKVQPGMETPDEEQLKSFLSGALPEYMIPTSFVMMEDFPLNPSGKVNLRQLPEPGVEVTTGGITAPRDAVEEKLATIWSEVLSSPVTGIDSNFFQLGGHSLKAALLADRLAKDFNTGVRLDDIFRLSTIRKLAAFIKSGRVETAATIASYEEQEYYPLAPEQRHMFVQHQLHGPDTVIFNMPWIGEIGGDWDKNRLDQAIRQLLRRHDSLRTSFAVIREEPVQRVHAEVELEIEEYDLVPGEGSTTPVSETVPVEHIIKDFIRPFDLGRAPLFRVGLIRGQAAGTPSPAASLLLLDMHHIISDGTSYGILLKEIRQLVNHESLAPLPLQYKDYCRWRNSTAGREVLERQEVFWLKTLQGNIPPLGLPSDFQRPAVKRIAAGSVHFELAGEEFTALKEMALKENCTLFILMLALFYVLLHKVTGREDMVVSTFSAGRRNPGLHGLVGMFVNTLVLRNRPSAGKTFRAFLAEVRKNTLQAFEHQDYPYDSLVEKSGVAAEVNFVLQNAAVAAEDMEVLQSVSERFGTPVSYYDIRFEGVEKEDRLGFTVEYLLDVFKKETVENVSRFYKDIVTSVLRDPGECLSRITN